MGIPRHRLGHMAVPGARLLVLRGLSPAGELQQLMPQQPLHGAFWRPDVSYDGRVIHTRWEYTDKPLWRALKLWTVNPDGTANSMFWGNQSVWPDVMKDARAIPGSQRVMFTGSAHHKSGRSRKFAVEVLDDEMWKPLASGTKVSVVCVLDFAPVTARKFRLNITEAVDTPSVEEWGLYPPLAGTEPTLSADCDLLSFACNSGAAMIATDDDAITLVLPKGTDLTKLAPVCTVSPFATVAPASGVQVDFSNSKRTPVRYTVTARATHYTRVYQVTVCASEPGTQLLLNPGFETGNLAGWTPDNGGNGSYLGVDGVILWEEGQPSYPPHQGNKMCRLQGPAALGLTQTVALAAGDYALGMWVQSRRLAGNQLDPGLTFELSDQAGKPVVPAVATSPAFTPPAGSHFLSWTLN